MRISLIVAMDENGLIGADGGMPWHLPDDLRQFKRKTIGKPILMGRRTFAAIGSALRERDNMVLTRDRRFAAADVQPVASIDAAIASAEGAGELVVIGGAQVYALALPQVEHIYLTRVHATFTGDVYFPPLDWDDWIELDRDTRSADADHAHAFTFIQLRRARSGSRLSTHGNEKPSNGRVLH